MSKFIPMCERKLLIITLMAFFLSLLLVTNASAAGKIAFASDRDGSNQIYVMNADGTGVTQVTYGPGENWDPDWSPGGSKIVFTSDRDGNLEIYVMNADGSGQTNLTNTTTDEWNPAWSPNASKIAFSSDRNNPLVDSEIYVMNPDGSGQTNLTNNPAWDDAAAWSPDGFKIAFDSDRDGWPNQEIYVMNPDGSGQTDLSNNPAYDAEPAWSPDGLKISFTSARDVSNLEIYVMNNDGTGQINLTNFPAGDDFMSDWSKDGTKIVFTSDRDNGNYEVYVMNANGSVQTNLTQNGATDYDPDWGPEEMPLTFYWKDYNGEDPGGYMPDIDQNQDFDKVIVRHEQTDPNITYTGQWTTYTVPGPSNGSNICSNDIGTPGSASFDFNGTSIRWIGAKYINRGIAEVWIDGQLITTVDAYGSLQWQQVLYSNNSLAPGQHTIEIKVTNQHNPQSSDYYVCVDAFDVDDIEREYCAPVAEANSLWWLDKNYDLGLFDIQTHTEYVTDINEDGSNDILDLVQELAQLMGTNVGQTGTTVEGQQHGIDLFLTNHNLTNKLYEHTVTDNNVPEPYPDLFHYVEAEVERSQDVKLDLGFWHVDNAIQVGPNQWQVWWSRRGGHAVTVAGVDSQNFLLAISDPDNDAAEAGFPGVVRPEALGHPTHGGDPSVHNNEMFASHDIYTVGPSPSPGGKMGLLNFPWKWNLPEGEWETEGPVFVEWPEPLEYCMTFTEIEAAVIVSPIECGNSVVDPGEECDDGNNISGDGCSATCLLEVCGNSRIDFGEQCDDGNTNNGDGCSSTCQNEYCGDGIIQSGLGETCDPPGLPGPGPQPGTCRQTCTYCGDGIPNNSEQCDDGNANNNDGCSNNCTSQPNISVDPTSFDFGNVNIGSSSTQAFTISNTGTANLVISSIGMTGGNTGMFSAATGGPSPCPSLTPTITPGGSCTITVTFTPALPTGVKSTILYIISNAPDSPEMVPLSGTGTGLLPIAECNLIPDATTIHRGGTLGIQATATNNTDAVQVFKFATRITKPGGGKYPPTGYLKGPVTVNLGPHGSISRNLSQYIPDTAPLGTYTYHGYVGVLGNIYDECQFQFIVTQ